MEENVGLDIELDVSKEVDVSTSQTLKSKRETSLAVTAVYALFQQQKVSPRFEFLQVSHGSVCTTYQNTGDSMNINDIMQRNRPLHIQLASVTKTSAQCWENIIVRPQDGHAYCSYFPSMRDGQQRSFTLFLQTVNIVLRYFPSLRYLTFTRGRKE